MSEKPVSVPFDVIELIGPLAKAVAAANQQIRTEHYFHLELRYPGDGRVGHIDGDSPDDTFRFAWSPDDKDQL